MLNYIGIIVSIKAQQNSKKLSLNAAMHLSLGYVEHAEQNSSASFDKPYTEVNKLYQAEISNITYQPAANNAAPKSFMAREAFRLAGATKKMLEGKQTNYGSPDKLYAVIGEFLVDRPFIVESNGLNPIKELLQSSMKSIQHAVNDNVQLNYQHQMPTNAKSQGLTPLPTAFDK